MLVESKIVDKKDISKEIEKLELEDSIKNILFAIGVSEIKDIKSLSIISDIPKFLKNIISKNVNELVIVYHANNRRVAESVVVIKNTFTNSHVVIFTSYKIKENELIIAYK